MVFPWKCAMCVDNILQVCCGRKKIENCCCKRWKHFHYFSTFHIKENPGEEKQILSVVFISLDILPWWESASNQCSPLITPISVTFSPPCIFILALFFLNFTFKHFKILPLPVLKICLYLSSCCSWNYIWRYF